MEPVCLHGETFFGSRGGCVEVLSLERKPAIPPADETSLNLLAERYNMLRGGVLGT